MANNVFSAAWWELAAKRAYGTVIAALLPLVALLFANEVTPLYALSVAGLSAVASFATSAAGLPELVGKEVPLWKATAVRSLKTFGQTLAASLVGLVALSDVDWKVVAVTVATATVTTLLRSLKDYLPEQEPVEEPVLTEGGEYVVPDETEIH